MLCALFSSMVSPGSFSHLASLLPHSLFSFCSQGFRFYGGLYQKPNEVLHKFYQLVRQGTGKKKEEVPAPAARKSRFSAAVPEAQAPPMYPPQAMGGYAPGYAPGYGAGGYGAPQGFGAPSYPPPQMPMGGGGYNRY